MAIYEMNPACEKMARLKSFEKMYERYRFLHLVVEWVPTCPATAEGQVMVAVLPGVKRAEAQTKDQVMMMKPLFVGPTWKQGSVALNQQIDAQRFMHSGEGTDDGVACTIYVYCDKPSNGYLRVKYGVEFAFPRPF